MKYIEKIKNIIKSAPSSKSLFLIAVGVAGLLLVLVSTFRKSSAKTAPEKESAEAIDVMTTENYTELMESKLEKLISDMLGDTKVSVMITLESGIERVYADEMKTDADSKKDQSAKKSEQSDSNQKTYVVMKDKNGNEHALLLTEKMPVIRGVVIVCDSGQTENVSNAVKTAVKSALNVGEEKICIIGRY